MRKTAIILLAVLLAVTGCAAAEAPKAPDFVLEGFDGEGSTSLWETNLFFQRMQERTGISFQFREFNSTDSWTQRKTEIAQSQDLPDVLFKAELSQAEIGKLYASGVLIDLRPYLEQYAPDVWALLQADPERMEAVALPDGAIPALPAFNSLQNNDVMWINTKWLSRLGLEKPNTAEELTEVLRAFREKDPNGNGQRDEIPLAFLGMWELRFLGHAFGIIDNDYYVTLRDGQVTSALTDDRNRAFLTWLHTLWQEGLIDPNGFRTTDSLRQITDEKKAVPYGVILSATPLTVLPAAAMEQYETLIPLEYDGARIYRDMTGDVIRGTFAITSACAAPEKLVQWVNALYTEEGAILAQYGVEGEEFSWNENGYWEWNEDLTTVAQEILPGHTISSGSVPPGIALEDFQLHYGDETTRRTIEQLAQVKSYAVLPYPLVTPDEADRAEIARIQKELMGYAEEAMACFVTGDTELNDENWESFCRTVHEKGLDDAIAIWQKYAEKRR